MLYEDYKMIKIYIKQEIYIIKLIINYLLKKNMFISLLNNVYHLEENINENLVIDKTDEKILPKLKDNNIYLDEVKKSVGDSINYQLQLPYLSSYVSLNDNFAQSYVPIVDNLAKFANDFYGYYIEKNVSKTREDIPEGFIISLSELLLYLLKNKKETVQPKIDQIIDILIFLGEQYANRRGNFAFPSLYLTKLVKIFDIIGKRTNENKLNVLYKKYLDTVVPRIVFLD